MQTPVTHIEGYDGFENTELVDDTDPGARLVRFYVKATDVCVDPVTGRTEKRNFVRLNRKWDLGRSECDCRVNDKVEFDETTKKWKVKQLNKIVIPGDPPRPQSHIKMYPAEWNAFALGNTEEVGTPLSFLFPHDPARAEFYKYHHISTIEQLSKATASETDGLGIGARGEKEKAIQYLARIEANSVGALNEQMEEKLREKEREMQQLQGKVADLTVKLTQLLEAQLTENEEEPVQKKTWCRKKKVTPEILEESRP